MSRSFDLHNIVRVEIFVGRDKLISLILASIEESAIANCYTTQIKAITVLELNVIKLFLVLSISFCKT